MSCRTSKDRARRPATLGPAVLLVARSACSTFYGWARSSAVNLRVRPSSSSTKRPFLARRCAARQIGTRICSNNLPVELYCEASPNLARSRLSKSIASVSPDNVASKRGCPFSSLMAPSLISGMTFSTVRAVGVGCWPRSGRHGDNTSDPISRVIAACTNSITG